MRVAAAIAVCCVLLWLMRSLGILGILLALTSGTSAGWIILIARRDDVTPLMRVTTCTVMGAIASAILPTMGRNAEVKFFMQTIVFSLIGAFIGMFINQLHRPITPQSRSDTTAINQDSP